MRIFQKLRLFQENFISIRYLFSQGKTFFMCQGLKFQFRCFKNKVRENGISGSQWLCRRKKKYLLLSFAFIGSGRFFTSSSTDHIGNAGLVDFEASQIN